MNEIEGVELEILQQYIDNGRTDNMSAEMAEYFSQLELIRGLHLRLQSKNSITKLLTQPPYSISAYVANKRYIDAINFFYLQNQIKKEAWRNVYAEKLDNLAKAAILTAKTTKDWESIAKIYKEAAELRGVNDPDQEGHTEEQLARIVRVYTTDITKMGQPRINRHALARRIDSYDITEAQKIRIKQEAMVTTPKLFNDETEN